MPENNPELSHHTGGGDGSPRWSRHLFPVTLIGLSLFMAAALLSLYLESRPVLSPEDSRATAEAVQFATAEPQRRATRQAAGATSTVEAQTTSTAAARELQTAVVLTSVPVTAQARETEQAPATHTAEARAHETAAAVVGATAQSLDERAAHAFGPSSGSLLQQEGNQVACDSSQLTLRNFVAEATFHNPGPDDALPSHPWDYGLILTNANVGTEYRLILASNRRWAFNLHSSGFDVTYQDVTPALDLTQGASNTVKLYFGGQEALLYINEHFITTLDLDMFSMGRQSRQVAHGISVCAGIRTGYSLPGRSIRYQNFAVHSLP